jgi:hypothetical protein
MSQGFIPEAAVAPEDGEEHHRIPRTPQTVADTGLSEEFIVDLLLKTLYVSGARTGLELLDSIKLPFPFLDEQLLKLQHRRMVEVRGTHGPSRTGYVFDLTQEGRDRGREALETSMYVGPAPVPLGQYRQMLHTQSISHAHVTRVELEQAFSWLVLNDETLDQIGPAINSARSMFLYGESGNGKTAAAETIAGLLGGDIYVPHAVEVDGQIIVLYDPVYHRRVPEPEPAEGLMGELMQATAPYDRRWVHVQRPVVLTGGELTLEQLDLQYDTYTKMYQAPFQVKANGGVLIVDDFGRQRVPPRDLLNRWIVPLEKRVDFLTLHTGSKFPVPFDSLVIFSTNIDPKGLVEEAFLRRIHYKIKIESPSPDQYALIFRRYCEEKGLNYDVRAVRQVYAEFYENYLIAPRGCHPRDIVDHLLDFAKYLEVEPALTDDLIRRSGRSYFLDFPTSV